METHNFSLSEEQSMILDTVRKFAQDQVAPQALENDEHRAFVTGSFEGLAELGMLGIPTPEADGGAEMGLLSFAVAMEEMGRACGSSARLMLSQTALCATALSGDARAEAVAGGETLAAFVGLDAGIVASSDGEGFKLSGSAAPVTAATEAELLVVCATTDAGEALILALPAAGVEREENQALGFRAAAPGRVEFSDTAAGADTVVARGEAATAALSQVQVQACVAAAAAAVGMAEASIKVATDHAKERVAFGKPLAAQQAVALKLANSQRAIDAARHLCYHAARLADAGSDARDVAAAAKLAACEAGILASDEAIQILGGYGFTVEYHAERHYRDIKTLEVMDFSAATLRAQLAATAVR